MKRAKDGFAFEHDWQEKLIDDIISTVMSNISGKGC